MSCFLLTGVVSSLASGPSAPSPLVTASAAHRRDRSVLPSVVLSTSPAMRVTVVVGSEKLRLPVSDGSKTIAWLQAEIIKRWEKKHKGEYLNISEIRTGYAWKKGEG